MGDHTTVSTDDVMREVTSAQALRRAMARSPEEQAERQERARRWHRLRNATDPDGQVDLERVLEVESA